MKIAIMHIHFKNWMGSSKFIFEVARRLRTKCEVDIYSHKSSPYARSKFDEIGCRLIDLAHVSSDSKKYWLSLPYYLRKDVNILRPNAGEYDALLATYFPMNWVVARLNRRALYFCFEPFVWFHDPAAQRHNTSLPMRLSILAAKLLYQHYDLEGTRNCEKVLTLSAFTASRIESIYGVKAIVAREGVDTGLFRRAPDPELQREYAGFKIILHSTNFGYTKGTDFLIESLPLVRQAVPNFKMLVTCTRRDVYAKAKLVKLAAKLGVQEHIEFLPFLEEAKLPAYFSLASVVVQPSLNEAASLPIKEAMACETPVIGSCDDGSKEDIGESGAGFLVHQGNVTELAERIITILKDNDLARSMGARGRERVCAVFSWDKVTDIIWQAISTR